MLRSQESEPGLAVNIVNTCDLVNFKEEISDILILSEKVMQSMHIEERSKQKDVINQARHTIKKIDKICLKLINNQNTNPNSHSDIIATAQAYYYIIKAYNYINKNGSKDMVLRNTCMKCIYILKGKELNQSAIIIIMSAYEILANTYYNINNLKAENLLLYATNLFTAYTQKRDNYLIPVSIDTIYNSRYVCTKSRYNLEYIYIKCLMMLGKLYEKNSDKSMIYKHYASERQLMVVKKYNARVNILWITNLLEIFTYLQKNDCLFRTREYLATAEFFLHRFHQQSCINDIANLSNTSNLIYYRRVKARICNYWVKYGISLLYCSKKTLLLGQYYKETNSQITTKWARELDLEPSAHLLTYGINIHNNEFYKITDRYIKTSTDARAFFYSILHCLCNAWDCYMINNLDHPVEILIEYCSEFVIQLSEITKYFTWYIDDRNEQVNWLQTKIMILKEVMSINNFITDETFQQILIELAISSSTLIDIKNTQRFDTKKYL